MSPRAINAPAAHPCGSCPYRRDVPSGIWAAEEYDRLPAYDHPTPEQPPGLFLCHRQDGRMCAGWVACHDMDESLALRLAARRLPAETIAAAREYTTSTPVFASGAEAAAHGRAEISDPGARARRAIGKLTDRSSPRERLADTARVLARHEALRGWRTGRPNLALAAALDRARPSTTPTPHHEQLTLMETA